MRGTANRPKTDELHFLHVLVNSVFIGSNAGGAAIVCTMKSVDGVVKINRSSTGIIIADQTTNKGEFEYRWQAGDTDTAGTY